MTTVYTKTIGPIGRDYATIAAAEADVANIGTSNDLVANDEAIVFEIDAGTYNETLSFNGGIVTDPTRNVTYKAAAGSEHNGDLSAGVYIISTGTAGFNDAYSRYESLSFAQLASYGLYVNSSSSGVVFDKILVEDVGQIPGGQTWRFDGGGTSSNPSVVQNCVVHNAYSRSFSIFGGSSHYKFLNNTSVNAGGYPLVNYGASNTFELRNNLFIGTQRPDSTQPVTVTGGNNFTGATYANEFNSVFSQSWTFLTDPDAPWAGSQAIYDPDTGKLVNASGNGLIGQGDNTTAPTTDITGATRDRGTYTEPGAFESDLLTYTKTIGPNLRDYTSFTTAEADVQNVPHDTDLVQYNLAIVFEADAGTYNEHVTYNSTLTTDAARQVTYKPATGSEHNGVPGDGVVINSTASLNSLRDDYMTLDGIEVNGSSSQVFNIQAVTGATLRNCIIDAAVQNLVIGAGAVDLTVENCVLNSTNYTFYLNTSTGAVSASIRNCTVINGPSGLTAFRLAQSGTGTIDVDLVNNIVLNAGGVYAETGTVTLTGSNNFSPAANPFPVAIQGSVYPITVTTDTSAASTGSQAIYVSSTGKLVNVSGNDIIGLGDASLAPSSDINGVARGTRYSGENTADYCEPGAYECDKITYTKTIGAGRDYADFFAAEADLTNIPYDTNIAKKNLEVVFEADAGVYNLATQLYIYGGLYGSNDNQVTFKAADNARHNGTETGAVVLSATAGPNNLIYQNTSMPVTWDGLYLKNTNSCITTNGSMTGVMKNCVFDGQNGNRGIVTQKSIGSVGHKRPFRVENCVFRGNFSQAVYIGAINSGYEQYVEFVNNTIGIRSSGNNNVAFYITGVSPSHTNRKYYIANNINLNSTDSFLCAQTGVQVTGANNFGNVNAANPWPTSIANPLVFTSYEADSVPGGAGTYAVYDATDYRLVNVSSNDLIGLGDASLAPATDILGNSRLRAKYDTVADPGAFGVEKRTIVKTIGAGRDYADPFLAGAAHLLDVESVYGSGNQSLVEKNAELVYEIDAGTYTRSVWWDIFGINDDLVGPGNAITFKNAPGAFHGGASDAGVIIVSEGGAVHVYGSFINIEGLVLDTLANAYRYRKEGCSVVNCLLPKTNGTLNQAAGTSAMADYSFSAYNNKCQTIVLNSYADGTFGVDLRNNFVEQYAQVNVQTPLKHNVKVYNNVVGDRFNFYNYALYSPNVSGGGNVAAATGSASLPSIEVLNGTFTTDTNPSGAGPHIIYDADTHKLVNVSGNDAIGVGLAEFAPTYDASGVERDRGIYCEPGPYESKLVYTKTIGSGRDYSDFVTAEADVENIPYDTNLAQRNLAIVFEADAGTYAVAGIIQFNSSLSSGPSTNVTYKPAAGSEHGGSEASGVRLRTNNYSGVRTYDAYMALDGIVITPLTGSTPIGITSYAAGASYRNLILTTEDTTINGAIRLYLNPDGLTAPVVVENCVFKNSYLPLHIYGMSYPLVVNNCTAIGRTGGPSYFIFNDTSTSVTITANNNLILKGDYDFRFTQGATVNWLGTPSNFGHDKVPSALQGSPYPITATTSYSQALQSGDYAVYLGATGALVDVSGNDVWQGGVGPDANSDVPTTDILGNPRSGSTANPGAFELDGYVAPTVITRTIGAGRDYATFTLAEAAVETIGTGTDLTFNNEAIVFEADAGTYTENVIFNSSLTVDATRQVTYKPAAGSEHGGAFEAGVVISLTQQKIQDDYMALSGLQFTANTNFYATTQASADGLTIDSCLFKSLDSQPAICLRGSGSGVKSIVRNCVGWAARGGGLDCVALPYPILVVGQTNTTVVDFINCTGFGDTGNYGDYRIFDIEPTATVNIGYYNCLSLSNRAHSDVGSNATVFGSNNFGASASPFPVAIQGSVYPITTTTDTSAASTGSQAIYDSSTGKLINASGNDIIGLGDATLAPATDIVGVSRSRGAYCEPGAFESDLITYTRTIGSDKDYTTFTAAEADVENIGRSSNLALNNEAIVFEADAGTYSESVQLNSTLTTSPNTNVTYKPATGSEHGGVFASGVRIAPPAGYAIANLRDSYTILDGLVLDAGATNGIDSIVTVGVVVRNCIIHCASTGISLRYGNTGSASAPFLVENCVIRSGGRSLYFAALYGASGPQHFAVRNCTLERTTPSIYESVILTLNNADTNYGEFINNLVINPRVLDQTGSAVFTGSNNFGESVNPWPAALQGSPGVITPTTSYSQALESGDYAVYMASTGALADVSGNDVWQGGVGPSVSGDVPSTDILGNSRSGATCNPGAFELDGYVAPTTLSATVGSGKDYATITLAEAAIATIAGNADLTFVNKAVEVIIDAGTYDESVLIDGSTGDSTRNLTFKPADGAGHNGYLTSGVIINPSSGGSIIVDTDSKHVHVFGLSLPKAVSCNSDGSIIENCVVKYRVTDALVVNGPAGTAANPIIIKNCVLESTTTGNNGMQFYEGAAGRDIYAKVINCTFPQNGPRLYRPGGSVMEVEFINNLVINAPQHDFVDTHSATVTGSNNFGAHASNQFPLAIQGSLYPTTNTTSYSQALEPGDHAVYMGATYALVDVSGNDVWQQGIGPASNSDVPTTDINGVARSGATTNPGAFEADGYIAPTTLSATVGSGKDYATIALAEAAIGTIAGNADLTFANKAVEVIIDAGIYTDALTFQTTSGNQTNNTDATRNVTYKPAAGSEHGGYVSSGVIIQNGTTTNVNDKFTNIDGLVIQTGGTFVISPAEAGVTVQNCIFEVSANNTQLSINGAGTLASPNIVRNCAFFGNGLGSSRIIDFADYSGETNAKVINCTFLENGSWAFYFQGPRTSDKRVEFVNNYVIGTTGLAGTTVDPTITITGSSNFGPAALGTAGIAGSPNPITSTTSYSQALESGDYGVYMGATLALADVSGNDVWQQGVGPASSSEVPTTDILGNARSGATANPGAFELDGYVAPTTITRTIGSGKDYANVTLAEADVPTIAGNADLTFANTAVVFKADEGTYTENITIDGIEADSTRYVTYDAADGVSHSGIFGTGVDIQGPLRVYDDFTVVRNFSITNSSQALLLFNGAKGVLCENLALESTANVGVLFQLGGTSLYPCILRNSTIKSFGRGVDLRSEGSGDSHYKIINNSVIADGGNQAFLVGSSSSDELHVDFVNNISFGVRSYYQFPTGPTFFITGSNNFGPPSTTWPAALQGPLHPTTPSQAYDPGAGDYALYVGKNLALLDSPNNDVINLGVGPASNSDVPTTDLQGNTRSGTTCNPGAFEQLDSLITVTKTIGPGGDYTTFTAAEADVENIATSEIGNSNIFDYNGRIIFEASAGTYSESVTFQSTLTTDATRNVTYKAATGSEHGGVRGAGVHVTASETGSTFLVYDLHNSFVGLSVARTGSNGNAIRSFSNFLSCDSCIFAIDHGITGVGAGQFLPNGSDGLILLTNCVFQRTGARNDAIYIPTFGSGPYNFKIRNCTLRNGHFYLNNTASGVINIELVNTLVLNDNSMQIGGAGTVNSTGSNNFGGSNNPFSVSIQGSPYPITATPSYSEALEPGNYAVYMGATGQLADVSGNDVWNKGIGPASNSDVPTTDITGATRSGTTCNPGAFERDGYTPHTVITKTIGSGKDYATFNAAKNDLNNIIASSLPGLFTSDKSYDLAHANAAIVFEADAGTYNEAPNLSFSRSTYRFDATRNLTFKAASGAEHKGIPHAGVRLVSTSQSQVNTDFISLQDLEFDGHQFAYVAYSIHKGGSFDRCIFSRSGVYALAGGSTGATQCGSAAHPIRFTNCVIRNKQGYSNQASTITKYSDTGYDDYIEFANCTFIGWHRTTASTGSDLINTKFTNCIVFSPSIVLADQNTSNIVYSGEGNYGVASNPFPSALKGSQYPIVPLPYNWDTIKATGSEAAYGRGTGRLANIPGNNAWNAGVGPDSNSDVPSVDIAGEPRTGTTTNPGAFQVPLTIPTNKTVVTKTIDPDGGGDYTTITAAEGAIHTICDDEIGHSDLYEANGQIDFTFLGGSSTAGQVTFNFDNNGDPDAASNTTVTAPNNRITFKAFDISDRHFSDQDVFLYSNFMTLDGFIVTKSSGNALLIKDNCHGLEVKRSSLTAPTYVINGFSNGTGLSDYPVLIENCEMKISDGTLNRAEGIVFGGAANVGDFYYKIINCQANDDQCTSNLNDAFIRAANSTNVELTAFNNLDLRHDGKAILFGTISDNLTLSGSNNVGRKHPFNFVTYGLGTVEGSATTDTDPTGAGPFIIYDASTNKLVDNFFAADKNAAWKSGVGPEVYTFIPFVDIEGKSRVGLSEINPGVYEVDTSTYTPPLPPLPPLPGADSGIIDTGLEVAVTENLQETSTLAESRSAKYNTRETDIRAEIFKQTKEYHNISNIYRETLRSMLTSFADLVYINSEDQQIDVPCIHGNAERAVAKIVQDDSIILPLMSVSQTTTDNDTARDRYESVLVHEKVWDDDKQRAVRVLSLAPRAVNIKYQLNIFGKYLSDVDQIMEQIRLKFNPEMQVPTEFSTMTRAMLDSEENAGQLDVGDKQDRVIKKTISITVRTYIPNPKFLFTSTGKIERYNAEII